MHKHIVMLAATIISVITTNSLQANPLSTGEYVGLSYNYAWQKIDVDISPSGQTPSLLYDAQRVPHSVSWHANGSAVGIQLGFNREMNNLLIWGAEIDYQQADIKGTTNSSVVVSVTDYFFEASTKLELFSSIRFKLGTIVTKNTYFGITGGYILGRLHQTSTFTQNLNGSFARSWTFDNKTTQSGWCIGVSSQYLVAKHLSFGLQYMYYQFASNNVSANGTVATANGTFDYHFENQGQLAKINLNYHF